MESLLYEMLGASDPIYRSADIVLVIDTSESMRPIIEKLQQVGSWWALLERKLRCHIKGLQKCRFKVIWFRDFHLSGENVYGESRFFDIINEESEFIDYLNGIETGEGESVASSALEALYMAMNSDFDKKAVKLRHVIVLITDKPAHPFEQQDRNLFTNYLSYMPKNIEDFYYEWQPLAYPLGGPEPKLDIRGRRLVLFAPCVYPWDNLEFDLEFTIRSDISQGNGDDLEIDDLVKNIAHAIVL